MPKLDRTSWEAYYGLLAYERRAWTIAGRYDRFLIRNGREKGYALTGAVTWRRNLKEAITAEMLSVKADPHFATGAAQADWIAQLNYRFRF